MSYNRSFYAFCAFKIWHISIAAYFGPVLNHFSLFYPVLVHILCYRWIEDYDDEKSPHAVHSHRKKISKWVFTHSKADSNLHGHCFATSRKQCVLWILFVSKHLNFSSAIPDHRKSIAWLISDGLHSAAHGYK